VFFLAHWVRYKPVAPGGDRGGRSSRVPSPFERLRARLEDLNLTGQRLKELGFENELQPIKVSRADHEGTRTFHIQTWDGKKWNLASDWTPPTIR